MDFLLNILLAASYKFQYVVLFIVPFKIFSNFSCDFFFGQWVI